MTKAAIKIFFSYSHNDEKLRNELEKHLAILKRNDYINSWHDRMIGAGTEWRGNIDKHLDSASIILLLISSDFLSSDYCYDIEMKRALERHEAGEALVIPIILRPVYWEGSPFAKIQALPKDAKPITSWNNIDEAFLDVAKGIQLAVEELEFLKKTRISDNKKPQDSINVKELVSVERIEQRMIIWVYGWAKKKQVYAENADMILDWTTYFDIGTSPRTLPSVEIWNEEIIPQVEWVARERLKDLAKIGSRLRVYANCCLTGGLLLGKTFSRPTGAILEVEHYNQIWYSNKENSSSVPNVNELTGNSVNSRNVVIILSVSSDIKREVLQFLNSSEDFKYKKIFNIMPEEGAKQNSIKEGTEAVSYAIEVRNLIDKIKAESDCEIHLFLSTPLSVALFTGHYLTSVCPPIQTYEYANPGYALSCRL